MASRAGSARLAIWSAGPLMARRTPGARRSTRRPRSRGGTAVARAAASGGCPEGGFQQSPADYRVSYRDRSKGKQDARHTDAGRRCSSCRRPSTPDPRPGWRYGPVGIHRVSWPHANTQQRRAATDIDEHPWIFHAGTVSKLRRALKRLLDPRSQEKRLTPPGPTSSPTTMSTIPQRIWRRNSATMPAITRITAIIQRIVAMVLLHFVKRRRAVRPQRFSVC